MRALNGFAVASRSHELKSWARFCISGGCRVNTLNSNGRARQSVGRERDSWQDGRRGSQPANGGGARGRVNSTRAAVTTVAGRRFSRRRIPCFATPDGSIRAPVESQKAKLSP